MEFLLGKCRPVMRKYRGKSALNKEESYGSYESLMDLPKNVAALTSGVG